MAGEPGRTEAGIRPGHVALVTGGTRGLGRAMAFGLAEAGVAVVATGRAAETVAAFREAAQRRGFGEDRIVAVEADVRDPAACDRAIAAAARRGGVDILINNAGLTFTYVAEDYFLRDSFPKFWELPDHVIQDMMDTNYVGADQMARRAAPLMIGKGWGRIVNVTTRPETMSRAGAIPYGTAKAALETATEVWSKELAGTGVTVNVLNPGGASDTDGMGAGREKLHAMGKTAPLVDPEAMNPPLLWLVSEEANTVTGFRFDARHWKGDLPPAEAAKALAWPAGLWLHPRTDRPWPL